MFGIKKLKEKIYKLEQENLELKKWLSDKRYTLEDQEEMLKIFKKNNIDKNRLARLLEDRKCPFCTGFVVLNSGSGAVYGATQPMGYIDYFVTCPVCGFQGPKGSSYHDALNEFAEFQKKLKPQSGE